MRLLIGWLRQLEKKRRRSETDLSIERIFTYAAWADKYDGQVHHPPGRNITIAMQEPVGAIGILAPAEAPLLGLLSLVLPAIAMGNTVVAVPSDKYPLMLAMCTRCSIPAICRAGL